VQFQEAAEVDELAEVRWRKTTPGSAVAVMRPLLDPKDCTQTESVWVAAYFASKEVRRDLRRLTAALGDDEFMNQIATELAAFTKPAVLAWAADDKFFPAADARQLAAILPDARVELISGSRTWVMLDQPKLTAHLIAELARQAAAQRAT
jgi:pimeloyl-ACP methyl ester carboxylesterase